MGAYRHNWRGSRNGCLTSKEENYVDERIDLSMSDPDLVPLIVQENDINYRPSLAGKDENGVKRMNLIAQAAESIGDGDIVNVQIRRYRQCQLSQAGSFASTIIPAALMHGNWEALEAALKRSSSDRDIGYFGDARRVRHKPVLWDLNLVNHVDILSSHFVGQEHRRNTDLKAPDNEDFKIPFTSGIHAPPPRSVELAKKILRTLD